MVQVGASEPGTAGVVDRETAVRVKKAVRGVAECFGTLKDAMGEAEALPSDLVGPAVPVHLLDPDRPVLDR